MAIDRLTRDKELPVTIGTAGARTPVLPFVKEHPVATVASVAALWYLSGVRTGPRAAQLAHALSRQNKWLVTLANTFLVLRSGR